MRQFLIYIWRRDSEPENNRSQIVNIMSIYVYIYETVPFVYPFS